MDGAAEPEADTLVERRAGGGGRARRGVSSAGQLSVLRECPQPLPRSGSEPGGAGGEARPALPTPRGGLAGDGLIPILSGSPQRRAGTRRMSGGQRGAGVCRLGAQPPPRVKRRPARVEQGSASSLLPRTPRYWQALRARAEPGRQGRRFPFIARSPEGSAAGGRRVRGHLPGAPGSR